MFNLFKKKVEAIAPSEKKVPAWNRLANALNNVSEGKLRELYPVPVLPAGVIPEGSEMAMDGFCTASEYSGLNAQFYSEYLGYQVLAQLSQSTEYQLVADTFSQEMTREWGQVKGDDEEKVELIEKELRRLKIRDLMRIHIKNDCLFGGSQLYIDIKGQEDKTDLPLIINDKGIQKGSLNGFVVREPMWSTPSLYNANDALRADYFVPKQWWVLGKNVHHSRLLTLITCPVPDMLKPAYNFYGLSMTQRMLPYVQRLQSVADSVAKVITRFSLTGLKTDMSAILSGEEGGANQMVGRAKTLALMRDNNSLLMVNKDSEEIFQINTPLSGLDVILDKFTQMVAYPSKMPVLKIFGTPTAGLGNTSDGELHVFYDNVSAQQEAFLLPQIDVILRCIQLSLFGEIDESIEFKFNSLYQLNDQERAATNLVKAQTAQVLIQEGIIDNEEARQNLIDDEESGFQLTGSAPEKDPYAEETVVNEL